MRHQVLGKFEINSGLGIEMAGNLTQKKKFFKLN